MSLYGIGIVFTITLRENRLLHRKKMQDVCRQAHCDAQHNAYKLMALVVDVGPSYVASEFMTVYLHGETCPAYLLEDERTEAIRTNIPPYVGYNVHSDVFATGLVAGTLRLTPSAACKAWELLMGSLYRINLHDPLFHEYASETLVHSVKRAMREAMHVSDGAILVSAAESLFSTNEMRHDKARRCSLLVRFEDYGAVPSTADREGEGQPLGPLRLYRGTLTLSGRFAEDVELEGLGLQAIIAAGARGRARPLDIACATISVGNVFSTRFPRLFCKREPELLPSVATFGMTTDCLITVQSYVPLEGAVCGAVIVPKPLVARSLPRTCSGTVGTQVDWGTCGEDGMFTNPLAATLCGPVRDAMFKAIETTVLRTDDTTNLSLYSVVIRDVGVARTQTGASNESSEPRPLPPCMLLTPPLCDEHTERWVIRHDPEEEFLSHEARIQMQLLSLQAAPVPPIRVIVSGYLTYHRYVCPENEE
jgi:hypothetical protein